jgi:hypothetical protein
VIVPEHPPRQRDLFLHPRWHGGMQSPEARRQVIHRVRGRPRRAVGPRSRRCPAADAGSLPPRPHRPDADPAPGPHDRRRLNPPALGEHSEPATCVERAYYLQLGRMIAEAPVSRASRVLGLTLGFTLLYASSTPIRGDTTAAPSADVACQVSEPVRDSAPRDPNASPVRGLWYRNADRTIWAGFLPEDGWRVGGNKTYWVRPQGRQLTVTGRRLGADGPPFRATMPCCYPTGFQIVGLYFPAEGCWEVSAKAGNSRLLFVTEIKAYVPEGERAHEPRHR